MSDLMCDRGNCPTSSTCRRHADSGTKPKARQQAYLIIASDAKHGDDCWAYWPRVGAAIACAAIGKETQQ